MVIPRRVVYSKLSKKRRVSSVHVVATYVGTPTPRVLTHHTLKESLPSRRFVSFVRACPFRPSSLSSSSRLLRPLRESSGAFYTLVPIRPRRRGERRSLRTFAVVSLRPPLAFNPRPRRLSAPTDAFELHPDIRLYRTALTRSRTTRAACTAAPPTPRLSRPRRPAPARSPPRSSSAP